MGSRCQKVNELGKWIMIGGLAMTALGGALWLAGRFGGFKGLPGDIHLQREHFSFHFPVVTCLLISVVLSVLLGFFRK